MELPQATVSTRRVRLRTVQPHDFSVLYELATEPGRGYAWRFRGSTPAPDDYAATFWEGVLAQFVVEDVQASRMLGYVVAYDPQLPSGHCRIALLGHPEVEGTGLMTEGLALFICYLFQHWPLRKLYAEVPAFTLGHFTGGLDRHFVCEGTLKEHTFFSGTWWDVSILAIYREQGDAIAERLLGSAELGRDEPRPLSFAEFLDVALVPLGLVIEGVEPETELEKLGLDSLLVVELDAVLAEQGYSLPPELLAGTRTVGDLHYYCELQAGDRTR